MSTESGQPQFAQCELRSKGTGYSVGRRGRVSYYDVDPDDDLAGQPFVLGYGHSRTLGVFICTSRATGMTCRSALSGHGFMIARERQRVFGTAEYLPTPRR